MTSSQRTYSSTLKVQMVLLQLAIMIQLDLDVLVFVDDAVDDVIEHAGHVVMLLLHLSVDLAEVEYNQSSPLVLDAAFPLLELHMDAVDSAVVVNNRVLDILCLQDLDCNNHHRRVMVPVMIHLENLASVVSVAVVVVVEPVGQRNMTPMNSQTDKNSLFINVFFIPL